jgi:hypothetical protein
MTRPFVDAQDARRYIADVASNIGVVESHSAANA